MKSIIDKRCGQHYNKRIKGTKPVGHESGISLLRKVLAKLRIVARILAPYAQGR